jgi:hypothetical protein
MAAPQETHAGRKDFELLTVVLLVSNTGRPLWCCGRKVARVRLL